VNMIAPKTAAENALGLTLPSRRDEDWKWTDLKRLIDRAYGVTSIEADAKTVERLIASAPLSGIAMQRVVVVNGKVQSSPKGLAMSANAPAIAHEDPLLQLNSKLSPQIVSLAFNGNGDQPLEILHVTTGQGTAIASRLHISIAPGASATIIETFIGEGEYLNNPVTTIEVAEGGRLDRIKIETESAQSQHLSHTIVSLASCASLNDFVLTSGAILNRQNANIDYNGENSSAKVSGAYLLKGSQHADTRLVVDHKVPHCLSRELFKCVMDDKSRGIFQGKVIVRKDAQKIDGKQSSHALLLSETAEFDAKPELEIYADDVVCGHGTTCGDLNHDHLFYLKSRGIPEKDARSMLVHAFVGEAIETVANEAIREALDALTSKLMTGA
jgi:Fe-S cluster assembly protein SufD